MDNATAEVTIAQEEQVPKRGRPRKEKVEWFLRTEVERLWRMKKYREQRLAREARKAQQMKAQQVSA